MGRWTTKRQPLRQLTLSPGLKLCKVRSDGGVDALLNSLDSEEDICTGGSLHHPMGPSVPFSCHDAKWHYTEECGGTHGTMFTTNIHHGGRDRDHIRGV